MSNKSAARLRQALRTVEYLHEQAPDLDIYIQVRDPKLAGGSTPALLLEGDALYEHGWSTKPRERVPVELSEDPLAIAAEMVADARELAGVSPINPSFRSVLICSMDDIPDWVDRAEFDDDHFEDGYACIAVDNDGRVRLHGDRGEPEDNMYMRDWAWVAPALDAAYSAGKADGLRESKQKAVTDAMHVSQRAPKGGDLRNGGA